MKVYTYRTFKAKVCKDFGGNNYIDFQYEILSKFLFSQHHCRDMLKKKFSHENPILSRDMGPKIFFIAIFEKNRVEIHGTKPFKYWKIDKGKSSILYMSIPKYVERLRV